MSKPWKCLFPCTKSFGHESSLTRHYRHVAECKERWGIRQKALVQAEFERASHRRRAEMREGTSVADTGAEVANDESWVHEGDEGYESIQQEGPDRPPGPINETDDGVEEVQQAGLNHAPALIGATSAITETSDPARPVGDLDLAAIVDFEEQMYGPEQGHSTVEEDDMPYLDTENTDDLDEAGPDFVADVNANGMEQLEAALENTQISPDSDADEVSIIESFPRAGEIKGTSDSRYHKLLEKRGGSAFHPFSGGAEFELVKWLNQLPLSKVDAFLQLDWVRSSGELSFGSGKTMREMMEKLPMPRMPWTQIEIAPRSGTPSSPVHLCYRDPVAAVRSLLDRPSLVKHMSYTPQRHWRDKAEGKRQYTEILTADWAWETQESLPLGSTLLPILLGSDKAHLTDHSGDKSAWPIYLSLGNIHSSIRNKPSTKCWILLAYIPIPVFTDPKDLHTALQQRLFHQCLKVIVSSLKRPGEAGDFYTDSLGNRRHCYPRIAAYLADYPEQILINVSASLNSPVTTAGFRNLGDSNPAPRRTKQWILSRIAALRTEVNPNDVGEYTKQARGVGLNAVDQPFWEDLPGYEPDLVICPDLLHGSFRMWRDHVLKWAQYLVGTRQLDSRVKVLQPLAGMRHFTHGVSHLSQWTGREDRELQRVLLAAIAGAPKIDVRTMRCLRAFHDFLYLAQYRSHTTTTLQYLEQSLKVFHSLKQIFITNGARRGKKSGVIPHFCFPKMAGLHMYAYHIPRMGTSVQFSTEITETCHQEMAKAPYKATNRQNIVVQMCAYMNRQATLALTEEVSAWGFERVHERRSNREVDVQTPDYRAFVRKMKACSKREEKLEFRNKSRAKNGYVWLTIKPNIRRSHIDNLLRAYGLDIPLFHASFLSFFAQNAPHAFPISLIALQCNAWYQCRVQRLTVQDEEELADARTIRAEPPSFTRTRHGRCNCALIKDTDSAEETGITDYRVGQVRLIFQPLLPPNHPLFDVPLAYVYWFSKPLPTTEPNINMYKLQYRRRENNTRTGGIILLSMITRLVQMIPAFGAEVNPDLTAENSADVWRSYYLNSFMDKETYQAVW